jgi:hypothetical protein
MKIRTGFVSNSSSSSFIVNAKSSMEVFNKMVPVIKEDYCSYTGGRSSWYEYQEPKIDRFLKKYPKNYNGGIIIPFTCNYETYIFPSNEGECLVETCNNHPWNDAFPGVNTYGESDYTHAKDNKTEFVDMATLKKYTAMEYYNLPYDDKNKSEDTEEEEKIERDFITIRISDIENKINVKIDHITNVSGMSDSEKCRDYYNGMILGLKVALNIIKGDE